VTVDPEPGLVAAEADDLEVTTNTRPPLLSAVLPIEAERLAVASRSDGIRTVIWPLSERYTRSYPLPSAPTIARFDAEGRAIAFIDPS